VRQDGEVVNSVVRDGSLVAGHVHGKPSLNAREQALHGGGMGTEELAN
jgi:hypothetical protein